MESVFFEPAGPDTYLATAATAGPWYAGAQHGGPPSALAAWVLERHEPYSEQRLARVTIDILRPIPVGKLNLRTRTIRPGRRIALLETVMEADGQEVLVARGWRIMCHGEVSGLVGGPDRLVEQVPDGPVVVPPRIFRPGQGGYLDAVEWRFLASGLDQPGIRAGGAGPVREAWARPKIPLLPETEPTAMSRTLLVADSGSGVSAVLPLDEYLYVNVDLTVVLPRDPVGEWIKLVSSTTIGPDGSGLAATRLTDQTGQFGSGWQTLLVAPR